MKRSLRLTLAFAAFLTMYGYQTQAAETKRLLVVPFANESGQQLQNYLSTGLAAMLAEQLESERSFQTLNGPLVLDAAQAALTGRDLAAANDLARFRDATHFVTGRFGGKTWDWTLTVEVYAVGQAQPVLLGTATVTGSQSGPFTRKDGSVVQIVFMTNIQALYAEATVRAFAQAGLPLSNETALRLAEPPTRDNWAFQNLARAYDRHFETGRLKTERTDLEIAEYAVLVDPGCAEAQRFYAWLLEQRGQPVRARIHYEVAIARHADDVRSLIALGRVETDQGNADAARGYLERAIKVRSNDPEAHARLAKAWLGLNRPDRAVTEYERARDLDGRNMETRRALVELYANDRRYAAAANELLAIVAWEPQNLSAVFQLAACLRADGQRLAAAEAYAKAAVRFPNEARLPKFRGDLLCGLGQRTDCLEAYEAAYRLTPNDRRLQALLGKTDQAKTGNEPNADVLGGDALIRAIVLGGGIATNMDESRDRFRSAGNDAALEMTWRGKTACGPTGTAAGAYALAAASGGKYRDLGRDLRHVTASIGLSLKNGEGEALTPDESREAGRLLNVVVQAETDLAEMRALRQRTLLPLLGRNGCPITGAEAADPRDIARRNDDRPVTLPEVLPPRYASPLAPDIAPDRARTIRFSIDNVAGGADYRLTVDDTPLGPVPAGQVMNFTATVGTHRLCLTPLTVPCGSPGTVRQVFLHDGWTLIVKR